jgi:two-component system sensor histidine kinase UhpB
MRVSDDGRGLSPGGEPGTGIRGMRERAGLIGASLQIGANEDGSGCAVTLLVGANGAGPDR